MSYFVLFKIFKKGMFFCWGGFLCLFYLLGADVHTTGYSYFVSLQPRSDSTSASLTNSSLATLRFRKVGAKEFVAQLRHKP